MSDTTEYEGDYITTRRKTSQGTDWRGTANVSLGDETVSLGIRLLNESEFTDVKRVFPLSELREYEEEEQPEFQERLLELQEKDEDELTDEEEEELQELTREAAVRNDDVEEALPDGAYDKIMWAGKQAIMPTEEDLNDLVFNYPTELQREILDVDEVPQHLSPQDPEVEAALKQDMIQTVEDQPFPIKLNVGLQAFMETIRALGNGLDHEE